MTSWFRAICDEHKEVCSIFCVSWGNNTIVWPLGDDAPEAAQAFLSEHWTCKLRLVRDDNEGDPEGYVDRTPP
jgi:hypothetical protein